MSDKKRTKDEVLQSSLDESSADDILTARF